MWKKAQNKMSEQKLNEFRRVLEMQDRVEIRWKEIKGKGGDEDGEKEAMIRRKFSQVLERYGFESYLTDDVDKGNEIVDDSAAGHSVFGDKRLSELWEFAQGWYIFQ